MRGTFAHLALSRIRECVLVKVASEGCTWFWVARALQMAPLLASLQASNWRFYFCSPASAPQFGYEPIDFAATGSGQEQLPSY